MQKNLKQILAVIVSISMIMCFCNVCFASSSAAEAPGINVEAVFSDNSNGNIICFKENLSIESGLSREYGYTDASNASNAEISVFDALIAVHKEVLGESFTKDTAKNYLDISDGWINKIFGDNSAAFGFMVNDRTPNDGVYNPSFGSYTALTADKAYLSDGDRISFFFYGDKQFWSDLYTMLSVKEISAEGVTLVLNGFGTFLGAYPNESIIAEPVSGIELTISRDGINFEDSGIKTDDSGTAKIKLEDSDFYYISAKSSPEDEVFISSPIIKVKAPSDNRGIKDTLLKNISADYENTTDFWAALDMAAYGASDRLTEKDEIEKLIGKIAVKESASVSELSKAVLAANAVGLNAEKIKTDKNTVNLIDRISNCSISSLGYVTDAITAIYAYDSKGFKAEGELNREALLENLLSQRLENGLYGYLWEGVSHNDIDSCAMALSALAKYYLAENAASAGINEKLYNDIKECVDNMTAALSELQSENGSYGNANTDAMMLTALHSLGIDPLSDTRFIKSGSDIESALLSCKTDDLKGFKYLAADEGSNAMATEQAFRALVSAENFLTGGNKPYNIYSAAADSSSSGNNYGGGIGGSGSSGGSGGSSPTDPVRSTINVCLTVTGDYVHGDEKHKGSYPVWQSKTKYTIPENSTAQDLISEFAKNSGYKLEGLSTGYISSVTSPDGVTIGEYTNGQKSGWLFKVNGRKPSVGISAYILKNSDEVDLYYSDDYTSDKAPITVSGSSGGSGGSGGLSGSDNPSGVPEASVSESEQNAETDVNSESGSKFIFYDISSEFWAFSYIKKLYEFGVINGYEDKSFKPENQISRAEFTAILAGVSGDELTNEKLSFVDTAESEWYNSYIVWAVKNGITNGTDDIHFSPNEFITREDMCVMIVRYMSGRGIDMTDNSSDYMFTDDADISEYAKTAVYKLKARGIVNGFEDNSFSPKAYATRAETAKIILLSFFE